MNPRPTVQAVLIPQRDFESFVQSHGRNPQSSETISISIRRPVARFTKVGDRVDYPHDGVWVVIRILPPPHPPVDDPEHRLHVRMKILDPDIPFVVEGPDGDEPWRP